MVRTAPVVSSTTKITNLTSKSATGQTYSFTSPLPATPTALSCTTITIGAMTLNWTDNTTNEIGYAVYRSTDGVSYTFILQTTANANSFIQNGLAGATTYHWRVFALTEGRLSNALAGTQATLCTPPSISQIHQTTLLSNYTFRGNAFDPIHYFSIINIIPILLFRNNYKMILWKLFNGFAQIKNLYTTI